MSRTMAKKRRKTTKVASDKPGDDPKPRAFVPRPCTACLTVREPATNYSRVYSSNGRVRYCKCSFCGNTWTQTISADQITTGIANRTQPSVVNRVARAKHKGHGNSSIPPGSD